MSDTAMVVAGAALILLILVVVTAVLLVLISVRCAKPADRGRAAAQGARELRRLAEVLLPRWPRP